MSQEYYQTPDSTDNSYAVEQQQQQQADEQQQQQQQQTQIEESQGVYSDFENVQHIDQPQQASEKVDLTSQFSNKLELKLVNMAMTYKLGYQLDVELLRSHGFQCKKSGTCPITISHYLGEKVGHQSCKDGVLICRGPNETAIRVSLLKLLPLYEKCRPGMPKPSKKALAKETKVRVHESGSSQNNKRMKNDNNDDDESDQEVEKKKKKKSSSSSKKSKHSDKKKNKSRRDKKKHKKSSSSKHRKDESESESDSGDDSASQCSTSSSGSSGSSGSGSSGSGSSDSENDE